jgi:outer membrane protein OmpA-like peptidoglycan-associated protein
MPCHLSGFLKVVMVLSCGLLGGLTAWAQEADGQAVERYRELVVEVLEARLQAEVVPEGNRIRLRTSPNRLLKTMRDVVRASAPYYFEGGIGEFRRFSARVTEGISELDGQTLSSTPRGWTEEDWRYYEVERAIQDVMILVAMDVGVYANGFLSGEVRTRSDLARDWEDLQGGSDPLSPEPLPDFGGGARDESSLDGLGGGSSTNPDDDALRALEGAIRELIGRVEALERGGTPRPPGGGVSGGGFPTAGPDGGWSPGGRTMFPGGLPESFTLSFPEGSAALGLSAEYSLNTLVEWMAARPDLRVLVTGHSDATGSERTNMELSRRRAQVVRYYLLERGVSPERVASAHFGESRPEWGGAFDRRVEVRLLVD